LNDEPTLFGIANVAIDEDAGAQVIDIEGITAGGGESQPLRITATSSNTALIDAPTIAYSSANVSGMLSFSPNTDQSGVAVITVLVEDGGLDGDLTTSDDNVAISKTFDVTVRPIDDPPRIISPSTIDVQENMTVVQNLVAFDPDLPPQSITFSKTGLAADDAKFEIIGGNQLAFIASPDFETPTDADGNNIYEIEIEARDSSGLTSKQLLLVTVTNETGEAAVVDSVDIDDGSTQRSVVRTITVVFDKVVVLHDNAFSVVKTDAGDAPLETTVTSVTSIGDKTQVTLSFTGEHTEYGSLADGTYELRIDASKILAGGEEMDGGMGPGTDYVDDFFRLYGDADGNGTVNLFDFAAFRSAFGKMVDADPAYRCHDHNGDGTIDLFDFAAFRGNFGKSFAN
jgi:hypothetical protein